MEMSKANVAVNIDKYEEFIKPLEEFFKHFSVDYRQPNNWGKSNTSHFRVKESTNLPVS